MFIKSHVFQEMQKMFDEKDVEIIEISLELENKSKELLQLEREILEQNTKFTNQSKEVDQLKEEMQEKNKEVTKQRKKLEEFQKKVLGKQHKFILKKILYCIFANWYVRVF